MQRNQSAKESSPEFGEKRKRSTLNATKMGPISSKRLKSQPLSQKAKSRLSAKIHHTQIASNLFRGYI